MLAAGAAQAQTSFTAGVVSDYRYRGMSLSEETPAAQLALNYDDPSGAFAGVSLSQASLPFTEASALAVSYAGFARPIGKTLSWEAGVSQSAFRNAAHYNYHEVFAGLSVERLSARLYLSQRYLGVGGRSAYAEVNGSHPLTDVLDLVGHLGYLRAGAQGWQAAPPARADVRVGVSAALAEWTVQLAWSATRQGAALYPAAYGSGARKLVLSIARSF